MKEEAHLRALLMTSWHKAGCKHEHCRLEFSFV